MSVKREGISGSARLFLLLFFAVFLIGALTADDAPFARVAFGKLLTNGFYLAMGGLAWRMARQRGSLVLKGAAALLWSACLFGLLSLWYLWQVERVGRELGLA